MSLIPNEFIFVFIPILTISVFIILIIKYHIKPRTLAFNSLLKVMICLTIGLELCFIVAGVYHNLLTIAIIGYSLGFIFMFYMFLTVTKNILDKEKTVSSMMSSSLKTSINVVDIATELAASAKKINRSLDDISITTSNITNQSMKTISSSKEIEKFISLITMIGDQINLLALNASIKAGRVGHYGRGFAVVANEIRKLADAVKKQTTMITMKVGEVLKHIENTWKKVEGINSATKQQTISMQEITVTSKKLSLLSENLKSLLSTSKYR